MKKSTLILTLSSLFMMNANAVEITELTGDTKLACETILCLSTGTRPSECKPSIKRYFSIKMRKPHDTFKARLNFLNLCPRDNQGIDIDVLAKLNIDQVEQEKKMGDLTLAIANLPHECTPERLNKRIQQECNSYTDNRNCDGWIYRIDPTMPKACSNLAKHEWTQIELPVYAGDYSWSRSYPTTPVWYYLKDVPPKENKPKRKQSIWKHSRED